MSSFDKINSEGDIRVYLPLKMLLGTAWAVGLIDADEEEVMEFSRLSREERERTKRNVKNSLYTAGIEVL